jgi:hypothetical protein
VEGGGNVIVYITKLILKHALIYSFTLVLGVIVTTIPLLVLGKIYPTVVMIGVAMAAALTAVPYLIFLVILKRKGLSELKHYTTCGALTPIAAYVVVLLKSQGFSTVIVILLLFIAGNAAGYLYYKLDKSFVIAKN